MAQDIGFASTYGYTRTEHVRLASVYTPVSDIGTWQVWKYVPDSEGYWVCWSKDNRPYMLYIDKDALPYQGPGTKFLKIHRPYAEKVQQPPREQPVPIQRNSLW